MIKILIACSLMCLAAPGCKRYNQGMGICIEYESLEQKLFGGDDEIGKRVFSCPDGVIAKCFADSTTWSFYQSGRLSEASSVKIAKKLCSESLRGTFLGG